MRLNPSQPVLSSQIVGGLLRTRTGTQDFHELAIRLAEKDARVKTRYFKVFLIGNFCKVEFG